MKMVNRSEFGNLLKILPPVDFCCVYGSTLHPNNRDKSSMVDYILGVSDPQQWHSENLKMNSRHYTSWIRHLGGAKLATAIADHIGVGVHFNPFVKWNDKMYKYGVVRMKDLVEDLTEWDNFYLSGRFQKPVQMIVDNADIGNLNSENLRAATGAALLFLPKKFPEEDLYARICSLSYMGDLRMIFAEDKNKVKKIVQGQFDLFKTMYKPILEDYASKDLLRFSSSSQQLNISQNSDLTSSLLSYLPHTVRTEVVMKLGGEQSLDKNGGLMCLKAEAGSCLKEVLRRKVMVSSARQAVAGFLTVGPINGVRYLVKKMQRAWKSRT